MRVPHKGNFRTFLDDALKGPRHFLESPKGEFGSPPRRKCYFSAEAFKRPFGRGYVQELVHDGPFVWIRHGPMVEASQEASQEALALRRFFDLCLFELTKEFRGSEPEVSKLSSEVSRSKS